LACEALRSSLAPRPPIGRKICPLMRPWAQQRCDTHARLYLLSQMPYLPLLVESFLPTRTRDTLSFCHDREICFAQLAPPPIAEPSGDHPLLKKTASLPNQLPTFPGGNTLSSPQDFFPVPIIRNLSQRSPSCKRVSPCTVWAKIYPLPLF